LCPLIATPAVSATQWDRVQTGGGCYTPTVVFSEIQPGLAYARTDVAGAYRWDNATSQWVSLLDSTTWTESHLNGVASVAVSAQNAGKVALACGLYTNAWDPLNGVILTSDNQGATWTKTVMPFKIGGNMPGRGMGERLAYDPNNDSIMFYAASDGNGLWKSTNGGINWAKVTVFPNPGNFAPQETDPIDIWNRTPGVGERNPDHLCRCCRYGEWHLRQQRRWNLLVTPGRTTHGLPLPPRDCRTQPRLSLHNLE
jgi:hypothetical protein